MPLSADSPASDVSSASTEGSARSAADPCELAGRALSARGKLALHALLDPRDDLVGLAADDLGARARRRALRQPPHRLLGQSRPELVEVARREPLPLERGRPLARQLVNQPVSLERQAPRALDQLGQSRRHGPTPSPAGARSRPGWPRSARSTRTGRPGPT